MFHDRAHRRARRRIGVPNGLMQAFGWAISFLCHERQTRVTKPGED